MSDYPQRQARFTEQLAAHDIGLAFVPPSADLEYLTGMRRRLPTYGNISYTSGWVAGCFFARGREPAFVLPRMVAEFDLPSGVPGDVVIVKERDDGPAAFAALAASFDRPRTLGVGARTWGETILHLLDSLDSPRLVNASDLLNEMRRLKTSAELERMTEACRLVDDAMAAVAPRVRPGVTELELAEEVDHHLRGAGSPTVSFDTGVWSMGPHDDRDATVRVSSAPLRPGTGVSFDFGAVVDGYCSDFGRTIHVGEPDEEYGRVYDLVMAAQQAGIDAVRPGATAADVHRATRAVIEEGGYGDWFRHRTGHCIGLDVHEKPFISEEDETPLQVGMTFTIEPSVFWPGRVGVRVEDIVVCEETGGRKLNGHPTTLVAND